MLRFKDGAVWTFRGSDGLLMAQTDRNGNTLTLERNATYGRITRIVGPTGRAITLRYSSDESPILEATDDTGRSVLYEYNGWKLLSVTDPAGNVTRYTYDANGRFQTITDPRGVTVVRNEYDSAGRVIRQTRADGGIWQFAYTVTTGTVTSTTVTDSRGNTTTSRFNSARYLISQTDALGQTTTYERAPGTNLLLSTTDPLGRVTRYTYDATGNVTAITDPLNHARTFTYDPTFNKVSSSTDPLGNVTNFEYDPQGNLTALTDPEQNTKPAGQRLRTTFTYNTFGQPLATTDPLGNTTTFTYTAHGDLETITDPLGNTTTRTYDTLSRLIAQTVPLGRTTHFTYDALDRLTGIVDALGGTTFFSYDGNGNLLTVMDAKGNTTTHTYDAMNRLATWTDPLNRTERYTYDPSGNLQTVTDRKGQVTTFTYDPTNRRFRSEYADGSSVSFAYDPNGNLIGATDSLTGTITRIYDPLDRLMGEVTPQGAIAYTHDVAGRRETMQVNGLPVVSYGYDPASRLTQIVQGPLTATLSYDPSNRRTSLVLPNGIAVSYTYNDASRLTGQTFAGPGGNLGDLRYAYDSNGNRLTTGGSWARSGIPTSIATSTYDAANQQLQFGETVMSFDANGNLLTQTDATGTTTYTWDARNRLSAISGPSLSASFEYDALGRRIAKTINDQTMSFHYDRQDVVQELGEGGEASYLRTLTIDETLARTDGAGTANALADNLGSTVALTDIAGALATKYTYAPFGEIMVSGPASPMPFQFTGRENDGGGLYFYRARYYAPSRGRFVQEDPLRFPSGGNFYEYVSNNPLRRTDPSGLIEWPFDAPMPWNEGTENMSPLLPGALVPTYGNWGGPSWSGGSWGDVGPNPPVDSMDECFKAHDECYGHRPCYGNDRPWRRRCDKELVGCLTRLPRDPRQWPDPAPTPDHARSYRKWAERLFKARSRW